MRAYSEYNRIDAEWLGTLPSHWDCKKIGALFSQRKEKVSDKEFAPLSVTKNGILPQLSNAAKSNDGDNRKLVRAGDFVINSRSDRKGSCGVSSFDGSVSLINIVLTPRQDLNNRYVHYLLRSQPFSEEYYHYGRGIVADLWTTRYSEMRNIYLPVPPRSEQDQIVRYLDWQVSKINKLIAAKKKEIAVLEEYKQTAIDEAVTKGISNHDFVTSNVDWIEQIPSSWKLKKIKEYFSFGKGLSITKANLVEEGIPVISYGQVHSKRNTGVKVEQHLLRYVPDTYLELSPNALVNKGDFIFADTSEDYLGVGNCVYIDVTNTLFAGYHTIIARSKHNENGKFFAYLFRSSAWRYQIRKRVNGVKVYSITQKILGTASVLIPPKNEQAEIVEYLDDICGRVDAIIENLYKRIDIFHEYRTRLISDVVTGQIDVRGIEIPDYEYVEEESDEETDETEGADEEVEEQEE